MTKQEIEQEAERRFPIDNQPNGRTLAGGKYDVDINYPERNAFVAGAQFHAEQSKVEAIDFVDWIGTYFSEEDKHNNTLPLGQWRKCFTEEYYTTPELFDLYINRKEK